MSDSASVPVIGTKGKKRRRLAASGAWKENEDELLMKAMAEAPKNWKYAEGIVGRTAKQCRDRYRSTLDASVNHGPWDRVEDEKLLQYHKVYGNQWMNISLHLPGRTENSVKSRYISLIRKASKKRRTTETAPSSRFRGVNSSKSDQKWKAQITRDGGRNKCIGYFADEKEAALACDAKVRKLKGEGAVTNFDDVAAAAAIAATVSSRRAQRSATGSSRFRGVYFYRASQKWRARIGHSGRKYNLGEFADEKEAALAYDAKARELQGEGAVTNFDDVAAAAAVAATVSSRRAQRPAVSSRFRGVNLDRKSLKWKAQISQGGRFYHLGYFADEKEAALAYDAKARELQGEGAVTNFDDVAAAAAVATTASSRRVQRPAVSSRFRGVSFEKSVRKWRASIYHGGRNNNLGYFADEKEAALAYDAKARELQGEGAVTNFDDVAAAAAVAATVSSRRAQRPAVSSRFRGVNLDRKSLKWKAQISQGGRFYHLGYFADEKEAALAYDAKARELQGEGAVTNFDDVAAAAAVATTASSRRVQRPAVSSRFRGVSFEKSVRKWRASIYHGGRNNNLGYFADEKEAALAYDAKARELKGEGAVTNFDDVAAAAAVVATVSSRRAQRSATVSSRFRGVCFVTGRQKWMAQIYHGGRKYHLGYFADEKEAALAYDAKARELQGEGAVTNFGTVAAAASSERRRSGRRTNVCGAGASLEQEGVTLGDCAASGIMSCFL